MNCCILEPMISLLHSHHLSLCIMFQDAGHCRNVASIAECFEGEKKTEREKVTRND